MSDAYLRLAVLHFRTHLAQVDYLLHLLKGLTNELGTQYGEQ